MVQKNTRIKNLWLRFDNYIKNKNKNKKKFSSGFH